MTETPPSLPYCPACGTENVSEARLCRECGRALLVNPQQRRRDVTFFLSELESLRAQGAISEGVYLGLRDRYRRELGETAEPPAPAPAATDPRGPATPRAPKREGLRPEAQPEGPGWLLEQQVNLLLYLGAFLIVIATVIFVGYSEQAISDGVKMALLVVGTLLFMAAGLVCLRFSRVQQAGVIFFAISALMVPLNFVGAYAFFFADEEIDPTGLWLAGSLASALFYGAVALLGMGRWYAAPMVVAVFSGLAAALVLTDAPPEAYPGSFIALALVVAVPSLFPLGRVSEAYGLLGSWAAHVVTPLAAITALALTGAAAGGYDGDLELATRWYLPPTAAIAALFYWTQAGLARRVRLNLEPVLTVVALGVTGGAAVTLVFALDVGHQWYGPTVAIVGWLYAAGAGNVGPRWFGQRHLGWMALGAITVSWLLFEGLYADFPRHGAGVHFAAAAFYLTAARLVKLEVPLVASGVSRDRQAGEPEPYRVPAAVGLVYAAGLTVGIGFFHLLSSLPAAETAEASDLSLAFFGLSLGVAAVAATMRFWWPDVRLHIYAIALGMSLFVLLSSVEAEGQVTWMLAVYTGVALALTVWEREPSGLPLPAAFGFFALLAAWRHYEPDDVYLPLVVSAVGYGLFAVYAAVRSRDERWGLVAQVLAFAYAAAAPIVGWVRLAILADEEGFVGTERFEETVLYQTAAASVMLLGLLVALQSWLMRRLDLLAGASALLMVALLLEIGHFRPENVQAYTVPLGGYLLAGGLLASRVRTLPDEAQPFVEPLQALGAAVLMGPSLVQSWQEGGSPYALILLVEALALLGLALMQRWRWLLATSSGFVVLVALRYLFDAARVLPNWVTLALAGLLLLTAGMAVLLGREQWSRWQRLVQAWWRGEPLPSEVE